MSNKRTIARNVVWNWAGTLTNAAAAFLLAPFLIHRLGATTYGIWILIGSMSSYFGQIDLGVHGSVGRQVAFYRGRTDRHGINSTVSTGFALCCGVALIVLTAIALANHLFFSAFTIPPEQLQSTRTALYLVMVNLAITFPLSLFDGVLWAHERFDLLNMIDIPAAVLRAGLSCWLVVRGYGLVGLAIMTLTVSVAVGAAKLIVSLRLDRELRISPRYVTRQAMRELYSYGLKTVVISIARMTRLQFTPLLLGSLLSPAAVTFYSIPKRLLEYTEKLFAASTGVLTPMAASLHARGDDAGQREILLRGGRIATTLSLLFLAFFVGLGKPLITLWMGATWSGAYTLLVILALGETIALSQMVTWNMLMGTARHGRQAVFQVTEVIVFAGLAVAFRQAEIVGVCLAIALSGSVFRGIAVLISGCRAAEVPLKKFAVEAVLPGALPVLIPASFIAAVGVFAPPAHWPQFLAAISVYAVLSLGACLFAAGFRLGSLLQLLRRLSGTGVPVIAAKQASAAE